jgi:hypothetical protein
MNDLALCLIVYSLQCGIIQKKKLQFTQCFPTKRIFFDALSNQAPLVLVSWRSGDNNCSDSALANIVPPHLTH